MRSNVTFRRGPGLATPPGYVAQGVRFNGSTTLLRTIPTGLVNGRVGILSFWFKLQGGDGVHRHFLVSASGNNNVTHEVANNITIQWVNTSGTTIYFYQSTATFVSGGPWHHLLASWNLNSGAEAVYIDGVADPSLPSITAADIDYVNAGGAGTNYLIGGDVTEVTTINADIADFYLNTVAHLDFSNAANRVKFINNGHPADLGANGQLPTGTAPIIFQSGSAPYWPTNKGSGGGWTMLDAPQLAASATNP